MNLELQINNDITQSMISHQNEKLGALRLIKSAFQVEKAKDGKEELNDEQVTKIIQKMVSQSTESALQYKEGNRNDLVEQELFLVSVYKIYLPEQLSIEEITEKVKEIITELGATSVRDMGKVMTSANKIFVGRADSKTVGGIVKTLLS